jgi:hypothetical protein
MKWMIFILLFTQSAFGSVDASNQCSHLKGDCEFYACMEEEYKCGRAGYPTGFGGKYCLGFSSIEKDFSEEGKLWIEKTRACLMQKILQAPDYNNCQELREKSFTDHVPCYVESGFCQLSFMDKLKITNLIKKELFKFETIKTGFETLRKCIF